MASYLVTGASRGIGLELVKQLLELPVSQVGKVFAVTRSELCAPSKAITTKTPDRAIHVIASVDDTESVQRAAKDVEAKLGGQGLDVLVNNAGAAAYNPGGMKTVASDLMAHQSNINVIGPQRMVAAFLPLLEAGNQKKVINVYDPLRKKTSMRGKTDYLAAHPHWARYPWRPISDRFPLKHIRSPKLH